MASALTLAEVIGQTRAALNGDSTAYSDGLLTQCLRDALRELNAVTGVKRSATIETAGGYELDVSGLLPATFHRVWFPYVAENDHTPIWVKVEEIETGRLRARDAAFSAGYVARVWYTAPHTLRDLDGATVTTLEEAQIGEMLAGACANAAWARTQSYAATVNANPQVTTTLRGLYGRKREEFEARLRRYSVMARQVRVRRLNNEPGPLSRDLG